jgi:DNA-binding response OmpR family regulator
VATVLDDGDHRIRLATGGQEALQLIEDKVPDLIVLDLMMPGMDGWEVLRQLRKTGIKAKTRVLCLTGKSSERDYLQGWKLGVDDYLTKPFEPDDLLEAVRQTLSMTQEQLQQRRAEELERANLLWRIESAFGEG